MSTPFYDLASLVVVPSGYKTSKVYAQKPLTTDGQLAFTRSTTATRVGPDGFIEKVRTNLVLQSEAFNTASWGKTFLTATANTTANPLNGAVTAETITLTAGTTQKYLDQSLVQSGLYNYSIYAKAGTHNFIQLMLGTDSAVFANFNISTGAVTASAGCVASVVFAGNGWYRCSMAYSTTIATDLFVLAIDNGTDGRFSPSSSTGTFFLFGAQFQTGDIATPYIATTTAAVSVGPVANVPRLDYLNSSCPKLLLEPQRTNNALYSEQLDNAAWTKQNTTVTANVVTSPSGYQDADKLVETSDTGAHRASVSSAATLNGTYSFFAKSGERTKVAILSTTIDLGFDLSNGTLINLGSGTSVGKIENYGNGWYRCSLPQASGIVALSLALLDNANNLSYTGNGTSGAYFWGAQLEVGAYATSYIPTLGASVTRGADACSKTGISSLIGQTEGAFMIDVNLDNRASYTYFALAPDLALASNYLGIALNASSIVFESVSGSVLQAGITLSNSATGRFKIAVAYKANDFVMYVNGTQIGTDTSGSVPTCSQIGLYQYDQTPSVKYNQALLFKTRLTNTQLAELTTI